MVTQSMNWSLNEAREKNFLGVYDDFPRVCHKNRSKLYYNIESMRWESRRGGGGSEKFYPQKLITLRCCLYSGLAGAQ